MARKARKNGPAKLVMIANIPERGVFLRKYVGRQSTSEAWIESAELANPELTVQGIKDVIEEFRVS